MLISLIISGLLLGAAGSLHCIGMCGPLMLSLPVAHLPVWQQWATSILYNIGRVVGYVLVGILVTTIASFLFVQSVQQFISIGLGIIIIIAVVYIYWLQKIIHIGFIHQFHLTIQKLIIQVMSSNTLTSFLLLGLLNAFLPCGMVYMAMAVAFSFNTIAKASAFMLGFGLGTLPLMLMLFITGTKVSIAARKYIKAVTPYSMLAVGVLLLLKGVFTENKALQFKVPIIQHIISCYQ